jgi:hypothetical protein
MPPKRKMAVAPASPTIYKKKKAAPPPRTSSAARKPAPTEKASAPQEALARLLTDEAFLEDKDLTRGAPVRTGVVFSALRTRPGFALPAARQREDRGWTKEAFKAALKKPGPDDRAERLVEWSGDREVVLTPAGLQAFPEADAKAASEAEW